MLQWCLCCLCAGQRQRDTLLQNIALNLEAWTIQVSSVTHFTKISSVSCCLRYVRIPKSVLNTQCHAASCVCSLLLSHGMQIKREKAVYHTLNKLSVDVTRKVLVGEAWVPASSRVRVQEAVRQVSEDSNSSVSPFDVRQIIISAQVSALQSH